MTITPSRLKAHLIRTTGVALSKALYLRRPSAYRPGTTVVTVNWNSLPYMQRSLAAIRSMSPADTEILVVDNASTDGSRDYLRTLPDIRTTLLPVNVGHGVALDLVLPLIDTEYVAILDIDAFPIASDWLHQSIAAVESGAKAAGALLHRNFIHPSFFVSQTQTLHSHPSWLIRLVRECPASMASRMTCLSALTSGPNRCWVPLMAMVAERSGRS